MRTDDQSPEEGPGGRLCVRNVSDKQPVQRVSAELWAAGLGELLAAEAGLKAVRQARGKAPSRLYGRFSRRHGRLVWGGELSLRPGGQFLRAYELSVWRGELFIRAYGLSVRRLEPST